MFFFDRNTWKKAQEDYSNSAYFREGIAKLMIPYRIDIKKYNVNLDCFKNRYSYSHKYSQGSTFSMIHLAEDIESWNLPLGYPDWFYAAFPDVVCWLLTKEGLDVAEQHFGAADDITDPNSGKFKVDVLKAMIELYLVVKSKNLEVSK